MKHTIVVFGEHGARIKRVVDTTPYQGNANALIDPDLSTVRGVPPHEWAIRDGKLARAESRVMKSSRIAWQFWLKVAAISGAISLLSRCL